MREKISLEAIMRPGHMQKSIVRQSLSHFGTADYSDISTQMRVASLKVEVWASLRSG